MIWCIAIVYFWRQSVWCRIYVLGEWDQWWDRRIDLWLWNTCHICLDVLLSIHTVQLSLYWQSSSADISFYLEWGIGWRILFVYCWCFNWLCLDTTGLDFDRDCQWWDSSDRYFWLRTDSTGQSDTAIVGMSRLGWVCR
jgi:hypothetical protein